MALAIVNNIVKWNPFSCSFVAYDNKLKLYDVITTTEGKREILLSRYMNVSGEITTLDWYQDISVPKALAFGTAVASVYFLNWSRGQPEYVALRQARKSRQQCTEVVWNKWLVNQVAAGFDKSKKENCAVVFDLETGGPADLKGNGDFPTMSSFSTDTVVSLCWLRPTLLAAGGDRGIVSIYDLRISNDTTSPMTVIAHANSSSRMSKKVKGIRCSPFDENVVATYSDLTGEPVKIWDMRKLDRSKEAPAFTIFPHDPPSGTITQQERAAASQSIVTAVEFSKARHNVIAVGTSQKEYVSLYSIKNSPTELSSRTPLFTIHCPGGVKYLSWQGPSLQEELNNHPQNNTRQNHQISNSQISIVETLFSSQREQKEVRTPQVFSGAGLAAQQLPSSTLSTSTSSLATTMIRESSMGEEIRSIFNNSTSSGKIECQVTKNRLLIATATSTMDFIDVIVCENQPLAYGALDTVIFGQGNNLSISIPTDQQQQSPNSPSKITQSNLLSPHIKPSSSSNRHNNLSERWLDIDEIMKSRCVSGYSIDSGKNIQSLHDELDAIDPSSLAAEATMQLLRAWNWVYRVELLHQTDFSLNLSNCGILQLLLKDNQPDLKLSTDHQRTVSMTHPILGCKVYISYRRSVGRLLCGWAALNAISNSHTDNGESIPDEHPEAQSLITVVKDFEGLEHFERAAALALWHGNIALAVKVLQRTIKANKATVNKKEDFDEENGERYIDELTSDYIQLLSLVAMCFAGYGNRYESLNRNKKDDYSHSDVSDKNSSFQHDDYDLSEKEDDSQMLSKDNDTDDDDNDDSDDYDDDSDDGDEDNIWESMCQHVLEKLEGTERKAASYLYAACQFLLESLQQHNVEKPKELHQSGYSVIHDERIAFEDRVAFACTYLSTDEMYFFLQTLEEQCMIQGNIEGLVITGLNTDAGFQLLQKYVDKRSDIQTAALMVARFPTLLGPPSSTTSNSVGRGNTNGNRMERQFLPEYRQLLNRWQFFIERASLDVELGRRYRYHQSRNPPTGAGTGTGSTTNRIGPPPSVNSRSNLQATVDPQNTNSGDRLSYRIPPHNDSPHIFLRCHYCGTSLPVDSMMRQLHYQSSTYIRKQKPVMFCCPNCKKPLPKCYICLSSMGVINPQAEIKAAQARRNTSNLTGIGPGTPPVGQPPTPSTPNLSGHITIGEDDDVPGQGHNNESTQNFLESGRWFMWCQHCKHGGHANCIDSWFHSHLVCGVNGCNCNCMIQPSS